MSPTHVESECMLKTIRLGNVTNDTSGASEAWWQQEISRLNLWEFIELHDLLTLSPWLPLWHFNNWFKVWINVCLLASVSHVQISESTGLEVWMSQSSGEKGEEAFPGAVPRTMSGLSGPSAWTLSFSELAARPGTYPSPPASRAVQPRSTKHLYKVHKASLCLCGHNGSSILL